MPLLSYRFREAQWLGGKPLASMHASKLWLRLSIPLILAVSALGHAQIDPDMGQDPDGKRLTKKQEREKFHPVPVKGMSAADRQKAYEDRLKLEAASPFSGLKWRNIGPEKQGGRVVDITAPLGDPSKVYVAFATGGLWRTDNDGITWESLFDNHSAFGIGAIAASRDGKTLWLGSGEHNSQRTSYAGDGVYKSTDSGKTWTNVGLPESQHIGKILIDPKNENVVWVAALGHLYSQNEDRGVYKTTDGGKTWKLVLKVDQFTGANDLVMDTNHPSTVIASMWDRDRRAWNMRESGVGSATYRTTDGGASWSKITQLPMGDDAGKTGLSNCATKPNVVYAFVDNQGDDPEWASIDEKTPSGKLTLRRFLLLDEETFPKVDKAVLETFFKTYPAGDLKVDDMLAKMKDKKLSLEQIKEAMIKKDPNVFDTGTAGAQVYRSDDMGKTWAKTPGGDIGQFGGYYYHKTYVNSANPDDVYVMGLPLLRSTDGGKTWKSVADKAHVDWHAVWNDPREPRKVFVGSDGGIFVSYDNGVTVRHLNNLPVGQATTLAVDNKRPYNVYLGFQDNGTMRGPSNYKPGTSDPDAWTELFGGDGSHIAVDPRDDGDLVYVAYQFGEHFAINQKTKEQWRARASAPTGDPAVRYNWISPLVVSPHIPDLVYLGAQRVYRSFNQGKKWAPISPDLTKNRDNGDVPHSTIKDISESPLRFGLIYVGCDDGNVKMTPDGGFQWIDIATPEKDKWVSRMVASRYDVGTVYCSQSGYREDDFRAFLWKSTDFGKTWKSIVGNLPSETINVVREDPSSKDTLYVGTDMGVYVTFDGGKTWETLTGDLPHLPVHDLAIQEREKDLVIATHARGAYILPLKLVTGLTAEVRKADLTIFPLDNASRSERWGLERRERWDSKPSTAPLLKGSFYTKEPGAGFVRIKDKDGKVVKELAVTAVRGYNFFELSLELEPAKPNPMIKRSIKTAEDALKDPYEAFRAKYIAIGSYKVEITVGTVTKSVDWKVEKD